MLLITRVTSLQDLGLYFLVLQVIKGTTIKVAIMSIKENYFIVDRGGSVDSGEFGNGFKPPISIHLPGWCVMDYPIYWDSEVQILELLLFQCKIIGKMKNLPSDQVKKMDVKNNVDCSHV